MSALCPSRELKLILIALFSAAKSTFQSFFTNQVNEVEYAVFTQSLHMKFPCQHVWLCIQHDIVTGHSLEIFSQLFLMVWLKYPTFFTLPVHREVKLINRSGAKKKPVLSSTDVWHYITDFLIHFRFVLAVAYSSFQCVCIGFLLLNLVKNTQRLPKSVNWLQISDLMLLPIALFQLCNQLYRLLQLFCSVLLLNCFLFLLLEWSS